MSRAEAAGDRVLALQVLHQAITNATDEPTVRSRARTYTRPLVKAQEDARRFLTASTGGWADARVRWCATAGISAEWLALHLANMAMAWANSARRRRLGLPPSMR